MSLPRQIPSAARNPSHSSSPSKSSFRSQRSIPQQRSLLPSPRFEDDPGPQSPPSVVAHHLPDVALEGEESQLEDYSATSAQEEDEQTHNLQPLFTLLHDTQTSEHYHPAVHYIFADDDTDIVTEAALRSLADGEDLEPLESQSPQEEGQDARKDSALDEGRPITEKAQLKGSVKRHYILVDLAPTPTPAPPAIDPPRSSSQDAGSSGDALPKTRQDPPTALPGPSLTSGPKSSYPYHVVSASSLSSSFAVLSAEIASAPTFDVPSPVATLKPARRASSSGDTYFPPGQTQGLGIIAGGAGPAGIATAAGGVMLKKYNEDKESPSPPLMLRIHGMSLRDSDISPASSKENMFTVRDNSGKAKERRDRSTDDADTEDVDTPTGKGQTAEEGEQEENLDDLVALFEQRLLEIRSVVAAAGLGSGDDDDEDDDNNNIGTRLATEDFADVQEGPDTGTGTGTVIEESRDDRNEDNNDDDNYGGGGGKVQ